MGWDGIFKTGGSEYQLGQSKFDFSFRLELMFSNLVHSRGIAPLTKTFNVEVGHGFGIPQF